VTHTPQQIPSAAQSSPAEVVRQPPDKVCKINKTLHLDGLRVSVGEPEPPTTKEQAIERHAAEHSPETICAPLKRNSPFQCTRTVEAPMVTRMRISLATAQAVFALVGVLFVSVLRKIKKSDQAPKPAVTTIFARLFKTTMS
jgi:hypothetical protein